MTTIRYTYNDGKSVKSLHSWQDAKKYFSMKGITDWKAFGKGESFSKTIPKKTLKISTVPCKRTVSKNLNSFARLNPNIPRETQTNEDSSTPVFNTAIAKLNETGISEKISKSPNIPLIGIGIGIVVLYFILKK